MLLGVKTLTEDQNRYNTLTYGTELNSGIVQKQFLGQ
jgi:hypothetical protein